MKRLGILGIILVLVIGGWYLFTSRNQVMLSTEEQIKQLEEKIASDPQYQDRRSQTYKDAQNQLCLLKARPTDQREKAITSIKAFIDDENAKVDFSCGEFRRPAFLGASQAERYLVDNNEIIINIATNHVAEIPVQDNWVYQKDGTRLGNTSSNLPFYSQTEIEELAKNFLAKHSQAIGSVDLSSLKLEIGKKSNGTSSTNYFLSWSGEQKKRKLPEPQKTCSKDLAPEAIQYYESDGTPCYTNYEENYNPQLSIAFTNEGRLISFSSSLEVE